MRTSTQGFSNPGERSNPPGSADTKGEHENHEHELPTGDGGQLGTKGQRSWGYGPWTPTLPVQCAVTPRARHVDVDGLTMPVTQCSTERLGLRNVLTCGNVMNRPVNGGRGVSARDP